MYGANARPVPVQIQGSNDRSVDGSVVYIDDM